MYIYICIYIYFSICQYIFKSHTIGEDLIIPALSNYCNNVLKSYSCALNSVPLSNDTVRRSIDEISVYIQHQLHSFLRERNFPTQLDESTFRRNQVLLISYVRHVQNGDLKDEMLYCVKVKTTTTAICDLHKRYLHGARIPLTNIIWFAANGAPAVIGEEFRI